MNAIVAAHVASVHIGIDARVDHRVIEGGVEYGALVLGASLHVDATQLLVPAVAGLATHELKVVSLHLGFEVTACAVQIDKRDAHAQLHLLVGFRGKFGEETDVPALAGALAAQDVGLGDALQIILLHHVLVLAADALGQLGTPEAVCLHRTAQLGMEEYGVRGFPVTVTPSAAVGRAAHPSLQGVVVQDGGLLFGGRAAHTPCQVNLYARQRMLGEGHAQDAAVGRGRCLYADAVVGEHGRVVARPCRLALLVIA